MNFLAVQAERQTDHGYALHVESHHSFYFTFACLGLDFSICFQLDFIPCKFYPNDDATITHVFSI